MVDDVVLNKVAVIERCVARVREEYGDDEGNLIHDITRQDSIILNLQRACEASIDLAMHVVRVRRLGIPQETRESFEMLRDAGLLEADLAGRMTGMVGFRNVAVHDYRKLDLQIVKSIVTDHLADFLAFTKTMIALATARAGES
jgi:uncharacterized protein YutE (UPF0331/DUF86 family)